MRDRILLLASLVFVLSASSSAAPAGVLLAQAGSTGGALGNDDKSVSGEQSSAPAKAPAKRAVVVAHPEPPPPVKHARPIMKPAVAETRQPEREPRARPVSLAAYDGVYDGASTGPCIPRWSWSFRVTNGVMTGESGSNISGLVRRNGAVVGKMTVLGSTYDFIGQATASGASGTWVRPGGDGCSGTWGSTR